MTEALYLPMDEQRFAATDHTAGPWDPGWQHGGAVAALLARALSRLPGLEGPITRLTIEILGPVPVGEVAVHATVSRSGRSVEWLTGELHAAGRVAAQAAAWRIRRTELDLPEAATPPAPAPPPLPDTEVPASFSGFVATAMHWRPVEGAWDRPGPMTVWGRLRVPLVAGEPTSPLCQVMALADCGNGVSALLHPQQWAFINPDLTVHLLREPQGEWFCLDAVTTLDRGGVGLAASRLFDTSGLVGRGAQTLYVGPARRDR